MTDKMRLGRQPPLMTEISRCNKEFGLSQAYDKPLSQLSVLLSLNYLYSIRNAQLTYSQQRDGRKEGRIAPVGRRVNLLIRCS